MGEHPARAVMLKDGTEIVLRHAEATDAAAVLALGKANLASSAWLLLDPDELAYTVEQEVEWVNDHLTNMTSLALLAVSPGTGELLGILTLEGGRARCVAHAATLGMAVRAEWRGRGIGGALVTAVVAWARRNEALHRIELTVFVANAPAIALYERAGFVREGTRRDAMKKAGRYHDALTMALVLET